MRRREFIMLLGGGGAVAWPIAARGQQAVVPVIGWMSGRSPADSSHLLEAFRKGLHDTGYLESESILIEYRWANGDYGRLPSMASELVNRGVALLVAVGGDSSAIAAKKATSAIPIVFGIGG